MPRPYTHTMVVIRGPGMPGPYIAAGCGSAYISRAPDRGL